MRLRSFRVCLRANAVLDGVLEIMQGEGGFGFGDSFFIGAELADVGQRLPLTRQDRITTNLVFLNTKPPVLNSDEWNELAAVVFDEENIVIAQLELGRVGHFHGLAIDRAA